MYKTYSYFDKLDKKRKSSYTNAGTPMFDQYEYMDIDGVQTLVKTSPVNRQEEIDSFAKSCEISNILSRFMNGEVELLNARKGFYADVRDCPDNIMDFHSRMNEAKKLFYTLPFDIKEKFDNDPEKFFTEYGTKEFAEKISPSPEVKESEVVEDAE